MVRKIKTTLREQRKKNAKRQREWWEQQQEKGFRPVTIKLSDASLNILDQGKNRLGWSKSKIVEEALRLWAKSEGIGKYHDESDQAPKGTNERGDTT